ncbi:efflux RND transporter periplasmic adaptor subunit [Janthinobacterium sp. 17J80-10]|uniref:efflux RND transporter periplasmic adaptor subunit n=1 Tax=Janthinobacterium sp. 17J80-10 TaxID=2497863 RepID=UPI0010059E44|nr:efflux RND transporter periplasmic adaptor subunit [Janthinobacterium sp. 17J80-10]QAU33558.1 efflux RND transporter periplasmic adaptor subunit [Janthinobacterium sp. 17J80-10]
MISPGRLTPIALIITAILLTACLDRTAASKAPAATPAADVATLTVTPQRLAISTELPGRLEAARIAQVRARVPGIVLQRVFREGSDVKAGDVLFRIDDAPFQANHQSAQAALAKAEANLAQVSLKAQRYAALVETNAISKQEYDDISAGQKQAAADVATAKAALASARLNLGHATVTAPISGRIGRAQVTEGALVGQNEATPLAIVQQLDPIYVNLTQSSAEVLQLRQALAAGQIKGVGRDEAKVSLLLEDGRPYPHPGKLLFSDISVDESTGAVVLRAAFPNPDRLLMPGLFVRARLEQAVSENAIVVPQQAVQRSADGASVMLVDAGGKVIPRKVRADRSQGDSWVVSEGLQAGDRVIVEGMQKAKAGTVVNAVAWTGAGSNGGASGKPAVLQAKAPR